MDESLLIVVCKGRKRAVYLNEVCRKCAFFVKRVLDARKGKECIKRMAAYIVSYDLNKPRANDDYKNLIEQLKTYAKWWHYLDSTWVIQSTQTSAQIRDTLRAYVDSGDELLVARLTGEAAWVGFDDNASKTLKDILS